MLMWRPDILEEALRIAKEYGILCIADEVLPVLEEQERCLRPIK